MLSAYEAQDCWNRYCLSDDNVQPHAYQSWLKITLCWKKIGSHDLFELMNEYLQWCLFDVCNYLF